MHLFRVESVSANHFLASVKKIVIQTQDAVTSSDFTDVSIEKQANKIDFPPNWIVVKGR